VLRGVEATSSSPLLWPVASLILSGACGKRSRVASLRLHRVSHSGVGDREPWHLLARGRYPHGYAPCFV